MNSISLHSGFLIELFFSCRLLHEAALYILQKKVKFFSFKTLLVLAILGEVQIQITFSFLDWEGALCTARQRCITCTFAHWTLHLAILLLHRYLLPPPSTITLQQCTTARSTGHALLPVPPKRSAKCNALVQQDLSIMKLAKVQGSYKNDGNDY